MEVYVKNLVMASVVFLMMGVGMQTSFRDVLDTAKQIGLVGRGVVANFIIFPLLVIPCLVWLPVSADIKIGIMLMAAAPIAPMAPPFVAAAKGDVPYSVGLMTIVALLSVVLTPLILGFTLPTSEAGLDLSAGQIVRILLTAQLIPIAVGMAILQASPKWTERLLKFVPRMGQIGLVVGVGMILFAQAEYIIGMGVPAYVLLFLLVVAALFIGDRMMFRESPEKHRALAISTAIRNVPLAFLIATENYAGSAVGPTTLVFATFTMILAVVYGRTKLRKEVGGQHV